jgi:hypothetical protein
MYRSQSQKDYMSKESVEILLAVKKRLEILKIVLKTVSEEEQKEMYAIVNTLTIVQDDILQVLKAECRHDYVEDDFDIGPDTSKRVTYCCKCESTF